MKNKKQLEIEAVNYRYKLAMIKDHKLFSLNDIKEAIGRLYGEISLGILMPILEEMAIKNHKDRERRRCPSCGLIEGCNCWAGVK